MGREVRHVPASWQHPKNKQGQYIPMLKHLVYNAREIKEGLRDGWLKNEPPNYGLNIMPQWPDEERTHLQMYENTSEGTPISPVTATAEELARWLSDNNASSFGEMTATYEQWLAMIHRESAIGMVMHDGHIESGVESSM